MKRDVTRASALPAFRPAVEALEDRRLLSAATFEEAEPIRPGQVPAEGLGGAIALRHAPVPAASLEAGEPGQPQQQQAQPITLTAAFLVNAHDNPMPTPDKGEMVFVEADWTTNGVPAGTTYQITYAIDGVTLQTAVFSYGAGSSTTQSWYWYLGGWYASPGTHQVSVNVTPTTLSSNTRNFTFMPVSAPDLPHKFINPLGGTPQQTWGVVNYVDVDPRSNSFRDYNGGNYAYDGHAGHDMSLANFSLMDSGVPDLAAADGTVVAAQDGNFDRNTAAVGNPPVNYVEIDHGNGWHTIYYHFRTNSIVVHAGDHVVAGQVLGLAGSSGFSSGAHLHFEVQHNGDVVEVEFDPTTYWAASSPPTPYQATLASVLASGVGSGHNVVVGDLNAEERPASGNTFTQAAGQELTVWIAAYTRTGDAVSFQFFAPDGGHRASMDYSFTASQSRGGYWYAYELLPASPPTGAWQVKVLINGTVMATTPFYVTAGGAGAARVTQGATYVPNGRTTPIDFGSVGAGATPPQKTFTVSNVGSAPLLLSNPSLPDGFSLVGALPPSVPVGGSATFTVQMNTAAAARVGGVLSFNTSDPTAASYRFAIRGTITGGPAAAVHGQVFLDANKDGIENGTELGLPGWTVTLYNALTSNVIGTTTTSFNGYYSFPNLTNATYQVRQFPPAGISGVIQTTPDPANLTLTGTDALVSSFGVWLPAAVTSVTPAEELGAGKSAGSTANGQRSRVTRLLVNFDQPVSLAAGAFSLQRLNSGGSGANDNSPPTDVTASLGVPLPVGSSGMQWSIPILTNGTLSSDSSGLADGTYTLLVHGAAVAAANGGALPGGDQSFTFHRLYGDTDGNRTVNTADYGRFRNAFGSNATVAAYILGLDFENNGSINTADYGQFRNRFGKGLIYA